MEYNFVYVLSFRPKLYKNINTMRTNPYAGLHETAIMLTARV